jgi:hypothetical protein
MEILNLTPEKGVLKNSEYNLGTVGKKDIVVFRLLFKDVKYINIHRGCGSCTKTTHIQKDNGVEVEVSYDVQKGGTATEFAKSFTLYHSKGETKIIFKGNTK